LVQFHQASDRKRQEIGLAGDHLETGANAVNFDELGREGLLNYGKFRSWHSSLHGVGQEAASAQIAIQ
jgi:hypothetical protein